MAAAGPAVLQVAGLYRGLCAVRSRALGLGLVSAAQLRVFPVRPSSGGPVGGAGGAGAELEANPFYDRYREKIQQLRRCGRRGWGARRLSFCGGALNFDPSPAGGLVLSPLWVLGGRHRNPALQVSQPSVCALPGLFPSCLCALPLRREL